MKEKFSDYEGSKFLDHVGTFTFEVKSAELKDSSKGTQMIVVDVEAPEGKSTLYFSLVPKARFSYNNFIAACLKLTPEQRKTYELDYETIHNQLIGKKFIGVVEAENYEKEVKVPLDDGTFETQKEIKEGYKIKQYHPAI